MDKNCSTIPDAVFIFPADFIKSVAAQKCGESCYWTAEGKVNAIQLETCMESRQLKLSIKSLKLCFEDGHHVCVLENIVRIPDFCDHDLSRNKIITSKQDDCQSTAFKIETETQCGQETKRKRGRPRRTDSEKQKRKARDPGVQQYNNIDGRRYTLRGVKLSAKIMNAEKGIYDETEIKTETSDSRKSYFRESVEVLSSDLPKAETELTKSQDSEPRDKTELTNLKDLEPRLKREFVNLADSERRSKMVESAPEDSERDAYAELSKNENLKTKQNLGYTTCINMKAENETVEYASLSGDGDSDDDFIPPVKRKKGRPKLTKKDITPRFKKRSLIDIGNVPTFERRKRNNEKKEECRICTKKFCDYTGLFEHVKKRHGMSDECKVYLEELKELKVVTCKFCGVKLADRTLLFAHEDREHRQNTIVDCFRCQKSFRNIANLRNHVRSVHILKGEKSKLCHLCPAKFKWTATLKQHVDEIHEGNRHAKCEICHKVFYSNSQLRRHERCHGLHQSKSVICQQCGKRFLFAHNLKRHVASMHGARQEIYHCSYCGRGYRTKTSMVSHVQLVHFNLFSYSCKQCQSSFPRSKMLVDHMFSAHKVVNYQVTQNPKERYKYRKNADDLYFCSYCSKGFHFKAEMVDHIHTTHADMFPHQCDQCNQGFLLPTFLLNHRLKAHGKFNTLGMPSVVSNLIADYEIHSRSIETFARTESSLETLY